MKRQDKVGRLEFGYTASIFEGTQFSLVERRWRNLDGIHGSNYNT